MFVVVITPFIVTEHSLGFHFRASMSTFFKVTPQLIDLHECSESAVSLDPDEASRY